MKHGGQVFTSILQCLQEASNGHSVVVHHTTAWKTCFHVYAVLVLSYPKHSNLDQSRLRELLGCRDRVTAASATVVSVTSVLLQCLFLNDTSAEFGQRPFYA